MKETLRERVLNLENASKEAFSRVRDELDEHLDGINSNTLEIQQVQDMLCEFDMRLRKMEDKIDMVCNQLLQNETPSFEHLPTQEQEILYLLARTDSMRTILLSHKLGVGLRQLESALVSLQQRGIPVRFVEKEGQLCVCLASEFKESIQTNGTLKLASRIAKQFS